jgi:hypothetical protein
MGVEELRSFPRRPDRFLEGLHTKGRVEGVGELPREHPAGVSVRQCHEVGKASSHRNIGDVDAAGLVSGFHAPAEELGMDAKLLTLARKALAGDVGRPQRCQWCLMSRAPRDGPG